MNICWVCHLPDSEEEELSSVEYHMYHVRWLLLKCSAVGIGFNGAETNCGIAHISGILLMNSYNTDIFFSNYYNLQSVHSEMSVLCLSSWTFSDSV